MLMIAKPAFRVNYQSLEAIVKKLIFPILIVFVLVVAGGLYMRQDAAAGMALVGDGLFLGVVLVILLGIRRYTPTYQMQPTESKPRQPFYVAKSEEKFRVQQMLYWIVKSMLEQGKQWKEIMLYIQNNHPDYPSDKKTLLNALKAGDAGCLYTWQPDPEAHIKQEQAVN